MRSANPRVVADRRQTWIRRGRGGPFNARIEHSEHFGKVSERCSTSQRPLHYLSVDMIAEERTGDAFPTIAWNSILLQILFHTCEPHASVITHRKLDWGSERYLVHAKNERRRRDTTLVTIVKLFTIPHDITFY
ncbi:hypothetical protein T12_5606 [Trichinella patagoniensis]|uniref:Uncharacterized protein n=1 Tax=Trichinella patagoniensis TaxID=990121 RepID=A0A0V0ZRB7_9BILA|nr:hypothetical protein T12_5606 [Trichinella patagoniensis]